MSEDKAIRIKEREGTDCREGIEEIRKEDRTKEERVGRRCNVEESQGGKGVKGLIEEVR